MLVVEDEPSIADVLAIALRYHRFEVMTAGTRPRRPSQLAERTRPDVALLDVMLPDGDGRALGRELRARAPGDWPLVFLTARDAPAEIVGALGFGDDYITKPFNVDEVVARITAVLRRTRPADVLPAAAAAALRRPGAGRGDVRGAPRGPLGRAHPHRVRAAALPGAQRRPDRAQGATAAPCLAVRAPRPSRPSSRPTSAICGASWTPWDRRVITTRRGVGYGLA